MAVGSAWCLRRLWPRIEPLRVVPLLSLPKPMASNPADDPSLAALQVETPGLRLRWLGNPAASRYRGCQWSQARTPWALQLWNGGLYVGLGDSSNDGPSANAGPVPLLRYDLSQQRWMREAELPEEEISRFIVHGGALWIPGIDPRGSWRWGNLYRRSPGLGPWWQLRTLPGFIHAMDLHWQHNLMVVAGNVANAMASGPLEHRHGSALAISADGGWSWRVTKLAGWRQVALLPVGGELYGVEVLPGPTLRQWLQTTGRLQRFSGVQQFQAKGEEWRPRPDLTASVLFPETGNVDGRQAVIDRVLPLGRQAVYTAVIGRGPGTSPLRAAFRAVDLGPGRIRLERLALPAGSAAMDLAEGPEGVAILTSEPLAGRRWRQRIWLLHRHSGQGDLTQMASFTAAAPGRSLAGDGQRWFVGLGSSAPVTPEGCSTAARLSGTVVELRR